MRAYPNETECHCVATATKSSGWPPGIYRVHGRADDAMNLGGIKVSSAEIERVLNAMPGVVETAAIAVPPLGRWAEPAGDIRGAGGGRRPLASLS